jgi:hypothetical protein
MIDLKRLYPFNFTNYVIIANNALYGTTNDSVIKMDIRNGNIIWNYTVKDPAPCTIYKDKVVFATLHGYTYCLNAFTGKEIWELKTYLSVLGPLTVTSNEVVYEAGSITCCVIHSVWYLIALNLNSGKVIDTYQFCNDGMSFWEGESNTYTINTYQIIYMDSSPTYYLIIIPNNNVVLIDVDKYVGYCAYVGYIPAIYVWFSSILIIWVSVITLILLKKKFKFL